MKRAGGGKVLYEVVSSTTRFNDVSDDTNGARVGVRCGGCERKEGDLTKEDTKEGTR